MTFEEVLRVLPALVWHCFMCVCELTILPWSLSCCFKEESVSWWILGVGKCRVLSISKYSGVFDNLERAKHFALLRQKLFLSWVQCKRKNQIAVLISSSLLHIRKYASNFWSTCRPLYSVCPHYMTPCFKGTFPSKWAQPKFCSTEKKPVFNS